MGKASSEQRPEGRVSKPSRPRRGHGKSKIISTLPKDPSPNNAQAVESLQAMSDVTAYTPSSQLQRHDPLMNATSANDSHASDRLQTGFLEAVGNLGNYPQQAPGSYSHRRTGDYTANQFAAQWLTPDLPQSSNISSSYPQESSFPNTSNLYANDKSYSLQRGYRGHSTPFLASPSVSDSPWSQSNTHPTTMSQHMRYTNSFDLGRPYSAQLPNAIPPLSMQCSNYQEVALPPILVQRGLPAGEGNGLPEGLSSQTYIARWYGSSDYANEEDPLGGSKKRLGLPASDFYDRAPSINKKSVDFVHLTMSEKQASILGHESLYMQPVDQNTWKIGLDTDQLCPSCDTAYCKLMQHAWGNRTIFTPGCSTPACLAKEGHTERFESSRCQKSAKGDSALAICSGWARRLTKNEKGIRCMMHQD